MTWHLGPFFRGVFKSWAEFCKPTIVFVLEFLLFLIISISGFLGTFYHV